MDQKGEVQAIGGANEKIEGFFDVCNVRGLTGKQGVVIPASNVQHLMLREDVVEAVRAGQFKVYSIASLDDAVELLMGVPAGVRGADGAYPADSINGRVLARLKRFAAELKAFSAHQEK
jgi:predicted ATP-dependent protease